VDEELSPLESRVETQPTTKVTKTAPVAPEKPSALTLTQPDLELRKPRAKGPRINILARDVDVKTILLGLAKEMNTNFVIDPGIDQTATVDLKDVTLGEALDGLLKPLRLIHEVNEDGMVRVMKERMETRLFPLNYVISSRQGASRLQAASGLALEGGANSSASPPGSGSSIASSEESDIWGEIERGLDQIIQSKPSQQQLDEQGMDKPFYSISRQSGIILATHYSDVLLKVAHFLEKVEGSVQRQVFIQAKIIEVVLSDENKLGIDWRRVTPLGDWKTELQPTDTEPGKKYSAFTYGIHSARSDVVIEALSRQGQVQVLSSPKIASLNNQRAVIKVGTEEIYFLPKVTPATMHSASTTTFMPSTVTEGIVLDVLPQINPNGTIMMNINTSITERVGERLSPDRLNAVPVLDVRQSSNIILAGNGQTIVIGGLMKNRKHATEETQPLFGGLFHEDADGDEKTELVIMLTPEIMVGSAVDDRFELENNRLRRMGMARSEDGAMSPAFRR
jgi:type II secretory pathway component GspD/PulD (secretin)